MSLKKAQCFVLACCLLAVSGCAFCPISGSFFFFNSFSYKLAQDIPAKTWVPLHSAVFEQVALITHASLFLNLQLLGTPKRTKLKVRCNVKDNQDQVKAQVAGVLKVGKNGQTRKPIDKPIPDLAIARGDFLFCEGWSSKQLNRDLLIQVSAGLVDSSEELRPE